MFLKYKQLLKINKKKKCKHPKRKIEGKGHDQTNHKRIKRVGKKV